MAECFIGYVNPRVMAPDNISQKLSQCNRQFPFYAESIKIKFHHIFNLYIEITNKLKSDRFPVNQKSVK